MNTLSLIVAVGERSGVIGNNGDLPWSRRLKPDMKWFVERTSGHPVIMGRKTWESIPPSFRPLDQGRTNIVLSSTLSLDLPMTHVTDSFIEATIIAYNSPGSEEVFVAGGARVYGDALLYASRIYKTLVDEDPEGDTFFPEHPRITREVARHVVPDFVPRLTMVTLER